MGSIAWGRRVLAEARHGVSPSRAREKRAAAGQNLGNARYVNHGPEMSRALAGVSFAGATQDVATSAPTAKNRRNTPATERSVCARGNVVPGLWVLDASNRRRLSFPASSEAGKAIPRPGRGFQGGRRT